MKKIVVACGTGLATSATVAEKVSELLDANGFEGQFCIEKVAVVDAPDACEDADLLIATTVIPGCVSCEYVSGVPFLTGMGRADVEKSIFEILSK